VAREARHILLAFGKGYVARVPEIVATVRKTIGDQLRHPQHVPSDILLRIGVAGEIVGHVAIGTLHAESGVEASHHSLDIDIRREDAKIARRGRALCEQRRRPDGGRPRERQTDYRVPAHGFCSESL
jgi:hypothetical protein